MSNIPGGDGGGAGPVANVDAATEVSRVRIKVNGVTIEVTEEITGKVVVREMLIKARDAGAIEGSVEEYVIERVEREGEVKIDEVIEVTESDEFLAVPTGSTEVA